MAVFHRVHQQLIYANRQEVWHYLSRTRHLLDLTPSEFHLRIVNQEIPDHLEKGMRITYTMVFLGFIRTHWVSEITALEKCIYFIDEQAKGPFRYWRHEHRLEDHPKGTLMTDHIQVEVPYGWMGTLLYHVWIKHQLDRNMEYRTQVIQNTFNCVK